MVRFIALRIALFAACPAALHAEPVISIVLDRAKVISLPGAPATIVVGNPAIADITALKSGTAYVLTGKGYGETNLVLLDRSGNVIAEETVEVVPAIHQMLVQRGTSQTSYACNPVCGPTVTLGDADDALRGASTQITSRNALAAPTAGSSAANGGSSSATGGLAAGQAAAQASSASTTSSNGQLLLNTAPVTTTVSR